MFFRNSGQMILWFKNKLRSVRNEFAFRQSERDAERAHAAEGERRFSTDALRREIRLIEGHIELESRERFGSLMREADNAYQLAEEARSQAEIRLALMSRDIPHEVAMYYDELAELKQRLDQAYQDLEEANSDFRKAQKNITSWHNAMNGKPAPRRSLFKHSLNELDEYKTSRNEARETKDDCGSQIAFLKNAREQIKQAIDKAKADRSLAQSFRRQGITVEKCRKELEDASTSVHTHALHRKRITEERRLFFETSRHQLGVGSRQAEIARINASHVTFLAKFKDPVAKQLRRDAFMEARVLRA